MDSQNSSTPDQSHPLARRAAAAYVKNGNTFTDASLKVLQEDLDTIYPDLQEAHAALVSVAALGFFLGQQGDQQAKEQLHRFVALQKTQFAGVKGALETSLQTAAKRASDILGHDASAAHRAPMFEAQSERPGKKLSDLMPNPALGGPPSGKR